MSTANDKPKAHPIRLTLLMLTGALVGFTLSAIRPLRDGGDGMVTRVGENHDFAIVGAIAGLVIELGWRRPKPNAPDGP